MLPLLLLDDADDVPVRGACPDRTAPHAVRAVVEDADEILPDYLYVPVLQGPTDVAEETGTSSELPMLSIRLSMRNNESLPSAIFPTLKKRQRCDNNRYTNQEEEHDDIEESLQAQRRKLFAKWFLVTETSSSGDHDETVAAVTAGCSWPASYLQTPKRQPSQGVESVGRQATSPPLLLPQHRVVTPCCCTCCGMDDPRFVEGTGNDSSTTTSLPLLPNLS
jgi:hypothetical protein